MSSHDAPYETRDPPVPSLAALPVDRSKTEPRSAYYKLQFGDEETGFSYYVQTTTVVIGRNCDRAAPPPAITSTPIPNIPPLEEEPLFPPPPSVLDIFSPPQPPQTFDTPQREGINGVSPSGLASEDFKPSPPNDHPADSITTETHDPTPHPSEEAIELDLVNPQLLQEADVKPHVVPDESGLVSEGSLVHGADSGNGSEPEMVKSEEIQLDAFDFDDALGAPPPPPAKSSAPVEHVDVDLGPLKSVSRNHAKISFVPDLGHFCLELMGRNGAWVNGAYFVKGATVPLTQGAQIQISTRIFSFILPPSPGGSPSYQSYALGDSPYEVEDLPYPYNLPAQDVRYNDFYGEGGPGPATAATMAARVPATFNAFAAGNGYGLGISGVGDGKWLQQWDSDEDSSENSDDSEEGSLEGEYEDDEDEEEDDEAEQTLIRPKIKIRARPKGADEQSELSSAPGDPTEELDGRGKKAGQGRRQSTAASVQDVDGDSRQKVGGKRPTKQTGKHPTKKGSKVFTEEDSGTMSATDDAQNGSATKSKKTKGTNGDSPPKKESKKKAKAVAAVAAALDEVTSEPPVPVVATLAAALAAAPPSPPKPAVARPLPPSAASVAAVRPPPGQPLPNGARPQQPVPLTAVRPPPHAVSPAVRSSPSTTPAPEIQRPFYVTELKETPGRPGHLIVEVPIPPSGSGPRPAPGPPIGLDGNPFIGPLQQKPNLTFANIIHRALVYLPRGRGTLGEVCNWIAGEWEWFRMNVDGGWQNSIRHNLSLNKAFLKVPRIPEDDPEYKGSVWILDPEEGPAFEEKQRRDAEKGQGKVKTAEPKRAKEPIRIDDRTKKPAEIHLVDMSRPNIQQRAQAPIVRPIARPNPAPAATPVPGRGVNAKGALQPKTKVAVVVQSITPAMRAKSVIATTDADGKPLPFVCDGTTLVLETGTFGHLTKDILDKLTLLGAASAVDVLSAWVDNKNKTKAAPKPSQGTATTTTANGVAGAAGSKPIAGGQTQNQNHGQGQAVRPPSNGTATQPLTPRPPHPSHPTTNKPTPTSTVHPPSAPTPTLVVRPTNTTTTAAKPPMQRNLPGPAPPGATLTKVISMIAEVANAKGDVNTVGPHASALLMYIRKVGVDIDLRVAERIWATGKVPNPLPERKKPSPSPAPSSPITSGQVKHLPPVPTSTPIGTGAGAGGGQNQIKPGPTTTTLTNTSNGLKRKLDDAGPPNEELKKPKLEAGGA